VYPETYRFTQQRAFIPFNLPAAGIAAGMVASALLILRCTAVVGGSCPARAQTAIEPNGFGTTLDATNADWASSDTWNEELVGVNATGVWEWDIDPTHLNYTGTSYIRIFDEDELGGGGGAPYQTAASFNSQNAGTPSNRPILRLTLTSGQVIFVNQNGGLM
jgi:hypothetical protein